MNRMVLKGKLRVPSWLLNQLPMWECSECGEPFTAEDNQKLTCSKCGGKRKPPSKATVESAVLKFFCGVAGIEFKPLADEKKRSEFAHNVLASKLTSKQREVFFQFFTEYVNSGWEDSGGSDVTDDGKWDGSNGSPAVSSAQKNNGSYSLFINANNEDVYKDGTFPDVTYLRGYFRFASLVWADGYTCDLFCVSVGGSSKLFIRSKRSSGVNYLNLRDDVGGREDDGSTAILVDTWYCGEVKATRNGAGDMKGYLDGVEECSLSGASGAAALTRISVGGVNVLSAEVYFDDVIAADAYIGPESGVSIPVIVHHLKEQNIT